MDPILIMLFIAILLIALLRLRMTYRRSRKMNREEEIRAKLAELRKRRDEE